MYIIVGLGNPGSTYQNTKHNIGFDVIDKLAEQYNISVTQKKHKALIGKGNMDGYPVLLVKPQTFMNLSGESVRSVLDFYKLNIQDELIIIYDDISLDLGQIRVRQKGSAGGHNGMKSIIAHLNTEEFSRIKVGVGEKPKFMDLADYVLSYFSKAEREEADVGVDNAAKAVSVIINKDISQAMNLFNKKVER